MSLFSRRHFIIRGAQLGAALLLPISCGRESAGLFVEPTKPVPDPADDHFFLQIVPTFPAGWDGSYLFDARPLEMTRAGLIQNYLGEEPRPWAGRNGITTLASTLTRPLDPFKDYFSVINGVHMAAIDGHGPNFNYLFSGSPLGGPSFIPRLNQALRQPYTLDLVQRGLVFAQVTNASNSVSFNENAAEHIVGAAPSHEEVLDARDPLNRYVAGRFGALGAGSGTFANGSAQMGRAMEAAPDLARRLERLRVSSAQGNDEVSFLKLAIQLFQQKMARSAILVVDKFGFNYDTHAASNAQEQPQAYAKLVGVLARLFQALRETPFDDKRSAFDVTTVFIASEFGRTMRQTGHPIDATGTDHNTLSNSVLVAGKGIRGGLVVGETDFRSSAELPTLTAAHRALDPESLRLIGRPFDFALQRPYQKENAVPGDYLGLGSVINTLYHLFQVPDTYRWKSDGSDRFQPILGSLLA